MKNTAPPRPGSGRGGPAGLERGFREQGQVPDVHHPGLIQVHKTGQDPGADAEEKVQTVHERTHL